MQIKKQKKTQRQKRKNKSKRQAKKCTLKWLLKIIMAASNKSLKYSTKIQRQQPTRAHPPHATTPPRHHSHTLNHSLNHSPNAQSTIQQHTQRRAASRVWRMNQSAAVWDRSTVPGRNSTSRRCASGQLSSRSRARPLKNLFAFHSATHKTSARSTRRRFH